MENKRELSPEIREQIEAKAREYREKKELREIVRDEELETVAGGAGFDPNRTFCGWTYDELHSILCWVYESYHKPSEPADYAKYMTIDVANSYIPSIQWEHYVGYNYPDFIEVPMYNLWSGLGI